MDIFLTGCYRSGTTLVANFLNSQKGVRVLNQPSMDFFVLWKKLFYHRRRITSRKWLGIGSPPLYDQSSLLDFLENPHFHADDLKNIERQYCHTLSIDRGEIKSYLTNQSNFSDWHCSMIEGICERRPYKEVVEILGSKEILCHEFIQHIVSHNIKVICVIRNPLDMIKSLNFGVGERYTGGIRPTLLNLRNWREIAQVALQLMDHELIFVLKYEDLIFDIDKRDALLSYLGIEKKKLEIKGLTDEDGNPWYSNTSFSSGRKASLDRSTKRYIESVCRVEMRCLGYENEVSSNEAIESIINFKEPWKIAPRDYYEGIYSIKNQNVEHELSILERSIC